MKTYFLTIALLAGAISICTAQPVIYKCIGYEFRDEKDPSKDKLEADAVFVSLDFNSESGRCFKLLMNQNSEKPEDVEMKWNIVSKIETTPTATPSLIKTTYTVRREVQGMEEPELLYMYKTEDTAVKTLDITIYDPKQKTSWVFNALIREL